MTLLLPCAALSQALAGRVASHDDGLPIPGAAVSIYGVSGFRTSATTNAEGAFRLGLPSEGIYFVAVAALGYAHRDSIPVEVGIGEEVAIAVELSTSPLEIEGIEIVARGFELRHRATLGGFRERHLSAPAIGSRRLFDRNDPEMRTAFDLDDVMKWFPVTRRMCFDVFVDGVRRPGWDDFRLAAVEGIEGVEFYADPLDAPIEFREGQRCAILAIWRRAVGGVRVP